MAAKLLHTLADDNADLQKQIGCMTGIFQIFDRHHALTGRRTAHKRLTLGNTHVNGIKFERESVDAFNQQRAMFQDSNLNRSANERQRVSTESSRLSFSSSSSSSLSSSEFNKGAQQETSAFDRIIFPESPARDPVINEASGFPHLGLQSLDLRDVVRDSMYREARGLAAKTPMMREEVGECGRREDTPRLYGLKQNTPVDLHESFRGLTKPREAPERYNAVGRKDAPRYSVDSRDAPKSAQKLKELPRLSLDSRERVMRNSNVDLKAGQLSKSLSSGSSSNKVAGLQQLSSKVSQKRPPSVVAKLMGLETLPGSPLARDSHQFGLSKINIFEDNSDPFSRSLREKSLNRPIRFSPSSPRSSSKDPASPRWKNADFVMKPLSSSRFPIEPAPWKQADRNQVPQKQASQPLKAPARVPNSSPSVYSEMEKRLKDLEFKHSGKDLRALKQILEAMQSKGFLESQKEAQSSNFGIQRENQMTKSAIFNQSSRGPQNHVAPSFSRDSSSSSSIEVFESPIVIMKPAKLVEKAGIPASSLIPIHSLSGLSKGSREGPVDDKRASTSKRTMKDPSPGNRRSDSCISPVDKKAIGRNVRSSSTKPQQVSKESTSKSSGSVSPRLQQKKLEFDKRSRPPTPPSDPSKSRRQSNRQPPESTSPGGRRRPKAHKSLQQNDDQLSQASNESRTSSHPGDEICLQSEMEVANIEQSIEIDGGKSPSAIEAAKSVVSNLMQNKSSPMFTEDGSSANLSVVAPEHPSPISVLDASIYGEIASSPVRTQNIKGNGSHDSGNEHTEDQWNPAYSFSETTSGFSPEINRKKLQNVEHLVQKLRRLNSSHDEASQDYIASLCENTDPNTDHRYISEILLASGLLLRDLGAGLTAFQLHPSGHPINPELFLVLEQTKGSNNHHLLYKEEIKVLNNEKLHRKLVFDAVNEILVEKLALVEATTNPWVKSSKMTKKTLSAQQLLKELCSEIETLQKQANKRLESFTLEEEEDGLKGFLSEDVMIRSGNWTDFNGEIPGVVLDVERLLFKDLVDEIVLGVSAGLRTKPGRRRMLFTNQ